MLKPDYVVGFIDAEGSFAIGLKKSKSQKVGFQVWPIFSVGQSAPNEWILEELKEFFDCGNVALSRKGRKWKDGYVRRDSYKYQVYRLEDITEKVIPFFDRHLPILKREVYERWREIIRLIQKGEHLTKAGMDKIIFLKKFF